MNKFGISVFAGAAMLVGTSVHSQAGGFFDTMVSYKDQVSAGVAVPAPMPIPDTTAWYVRGDFAYSGFEDVSLVEDRQYSLTDTDIDDSWSVGGGVGYYFNPWLRGDLTVDYLADAEILGYNLDATAPVGGGFRKFDFHSTVALANLYVDLNQFGGFSPYIGVGLGVAFNNASAGDAVGTTYPNGTSGTIIGGSETNFAWALMAGASYQIWKGLRVDANYRYLNLGSVTTGIIEDTTVDVNVAPPARTVRNAGSIATDDFIVHQFRVGFRQDIW